MTAANKNLAWNAKNITKTITAVEQLFMKINDVIAIAVYKLYTYYALGENF